MRKTLSLVVAAVALCAVCAAPGKAQSGNNPAIVPYSTQYEDLSVQWWQWVLSMPLRMPPTTGDVYHPLFDMTGAAAWNGQPQPGTVFFLGGAMGMFDAAGQLTSPPSTLITRDVTIPATARIFLPILNLETDNVGVYPPSSVQALYAWANELVGTYQDMYAIIDHKPVQDLWSYRSISRPFNYTLPPQDNIYQNFGVDIAGTVAPAVSDGIYLLIERLSPGKHVIESGGVGFGGAFEIHIRYNITVPRK
jgi:hypothetical protein